MTISLGGLASGIDTQSLVDSLVSVAQQPIMALDTKRAQLDSASSTISTLSTKLSSLKTAALALSTTVGFSSFTSSSSDASIVTSPSGSANIGTYEIAVTALARAQKTRSISFPSATTALGFSGTLGIKVGAADSKPVDILDTDTLSDIATKISALGAGVTAAIINDGTSSRLLLQGADTGVDGAFTIDQTGAAFGFDDSANTYVIAQNAALTVDGLPVTSKTNQITDAIPGVKLALTKITTAPVTVSVTSDATSLKTKINTFITAYNDFVNAGHVATGFGGNKATNAVLSGDSAVRSALHKIGASLGNAVPGTSGTYTTMRSVGLTLSREGTLSLDATAFDVAMTKSPDSVRRLFITDATTGATGIMKTMMGTVDSLVSGTGAPLQARINSFSAQSKRLADSKIKMQSRVDDYQAQLKKQFTAMDQLVSKYKTQGMALDAATGNRSSSGNSG